MLNFYAHFKYNNMSEISCEFDSGAQNLAALLEVINNKFPSDFEEMDIDGKSIKILTIKDMPGYLDQIVNNGSIKNPIKDLPLWAKVWPASFVLGRFLRHCACAGKTMLELGAGVGVCSLIAARWGFSQIMATDINKDALLFCQVNILANNLQNTIKTQYLNLCSSNVCFDKTDCSRTFDYICASEILYLKELHLPLLKFIKKYLAQSGQVYLCVDWVRNQPCFLQLASENFKIRQGKIGVKTTEEDGQIKRRVYNMMILEHK